MEKNKTGKEHRKCQCENGGMQLQFKCYLKPLKENMQEVSKYWLMQWSHSDKSQTVDPNSLGKVLGLEMCREQDQSHSDGRDFGASKLHRVCCCDHERLGAMIALLQS